MVFSMIVEDSDGILKISCTLAVSSEHVQVCSFYSPICTQPYASNTFILQKVEGKKTPLGQQSIKGARTSLIIHEVTIARE